MTNKNTIKASTDRVKLTFNINYYWFLCKYFKKTSPLKNYDFDSLRRNILSFEFKEYTLLYNKDQLKKDDKFLFKPEHLYKYEDKLGRKIIFKYRLPGTNYSCIYLEFLPTVESNFSYLELLGILNDLNLNYRDFFLSYIETSFDFYGSKHKNILNHSYSKSDLLRDCPNRSWKLLSDSFA